jgi:hypothetical protein
MEVGKCSILYNGERDGYDKTYRDYYVSLLKDILIDSEYSINIICGDEEYDFQNGRQTLRVEFNYEHTLVAQGGRSTEGAFIGNVIYRGEEPYLVRIDRFPILKSADIIIDYSIPNITNVARSHLTKFAEKMVYISPTLFDVDDTPLNRSIDVLTTFIRTDQPRRATMINMLNGLPHINRNDCFTKELLHALYRDTKILINIHQTDHHHTFEELRVLPALECGVIVVSEVSALQEMVPYHEYIIWETYDTIVERVKDILLNYDSYYDRIFKQPKSMKLGSIHDENVKRLRMQLEFSLSNKKT